MIKRILTLALLVTVFIVPLAETASAASRSYATATVNMLTGPGDRLSRNYYCPEGTASCRLWVHVTASLV